MRRKKGQSTLEYVIGLTAIVAAIAYAASQWFRPAVHTAVEDASTSMTNATNRLPQLGAGGAP